MGPLISGKSSSHQYYALARCAGVDQLTLPHPCGFGINSSTLYFEGFYIPISQGFQSLKVG